MAAPTDTTAAEVAAATARPILEFGRGWMLDPATVERANELGLNGLWGFWVNGRAGVLGDVDADMVTSTIGFMHRDMVREMWDGRPTTLSAAEATGHYVDTAASWGREKLADIPGDRLLRLDELSRRIAATAVPSVGSLFAGWRALEPPTDPAGAVTVSLNVLREMRGGAHLHAVHAAGLGPDGAVMSTDDPLRGGSTGLSRFGWPLPHPDVNADALTEAERMTTAIVEPAYASLDGSERGEFVELVTEVRSTMDA
jgi:Helix-turn-helix family